MKWIFPLALVLLLSRGYAQENANPHDVQVSTRAIDGRIQVNASYTVPINICSAFAFITAYEAAKIYPEYWNQK